MKNIDIEVLNNIVTFLETAEYSNDEDISLSPFYSEKLKNIISELTSQIKEDKKFFINQMMYYLSNGGQLTIPSNTSILKSADVVAFRFYKGEILCMIQEDDEFVIHKCICAHSAGGELMTVESIGIHLSSICSSELAYTYLKYNIKKAISKLNEEYPAREFSNDTDWIKVK